MQQLQPNTTLQGGKYKIERVLGQGGFGNTYIATNTVFDDHVAIKEFFMQGVNDRDENSGTVTIGVESNTQQFDEQKEKFKKEARRLWKLKNEHIVKVHDLFEENGTAYYVMDYIDGESLAEKLKRTGKPMSEQDIKKLLPQILDALKEVHQNEIWHLDLKPGNIIVDKLGNAYLIDFGASKQIRANGSMTTSTALCYTPGYAPNEQIGQIYDRFGPWTDIYALGATIYNLLTNKKPPMAIDIEEDGEKAFDFPSNVSENMRKMVVWMMQPKRKARPQSVEEILSKLSSTEENPEKPQTVRNTEETIVASPIPVDDEETILAGKEVRRFGKFNAVDLGLSVLWADCNVGGDSESPIGGLYGWADPSGEKTSQNVKDYLEIVGETYVKTPQNISGTRYDIATAKWGKEWRIPSKDNWKELVEKCKWTKEKAFHVNGYRVEGPNGNSIFLPNTGLRFGKDILDTYSGFYWTSEMAEDDVDCAYYCNFNKDGYSYASTNNYVYSGFAVRPVCAKK